MWKRYSEFGVYIFLGRSFFYYCDFLPIYWFLVQAKSKILQAFIQNCRMKAKKNLRLLVKKSKRNQDCGQNIKKNIEPQFFGFN